MEEYIATFYSHFGAIRFRKLCEKAGWQAKTMPVPRKLSSSCGTCVRYQGDQMCPQEKLPEEIEQIVLITGDGYRQLYKAQDA